MARDASGGSFFCTNRCGMPPAAHSFLSCQKRMGRKEAPENEIALSRLKRHFDSAYHSPMARPARNALRAALESGFQSARYVVQVVLFTPVEYLTYGIRSVSNIKRLVGADASVRPTLPQSISTTTPVWQSRICIAFCKSKNNFSTNQTPGKIQGRGGAAPFLVVLRGLQRGKAPTRIQRSDSCGKRRNNGTDEACPPQAADRMRDVEFVPTQLPLDYAFFRPSTALSFSYEKESGVETVPFLPRQKRVDCRRHSY